MTILVALLGSIGGAALISEAAFRSTLTTRGRVVLPLILGTLTWLIWLGFRFIHEVLR